MIPPLRFAALDRAAKRRIRASHTFCDARQCWIPNEDLEPEPTDAELVAMDVGECPEPVRSYDDRRRHARSWVYEDGSERHMSLSKAIELDIYNPFVVQYKGKIEKE